MVSLLRGHNVRSSGPGSLDGGEGGCAVAWWEDGRVFSPELGVPEGDPPGKEGAPMKEGVPEFEACFEGSPSNVFRT